MKQKETTRSKKQDYPKGEEKSVSIEIGDQVVLQSLSGLQGENLKVIEKELEIRLGQSHSGITVKGQDTEVDLAVDLISQLEQLVKRGDHIAPLDIERAIKLLSSNRHLRLTELWNEQVRINGRKQTLVAKTPNQKQYLDLIRNNDLVFAVGPAGTGKTYLAMGMAVSALLNKEVKRIVLCRPAVEAGEKLGFLPGDIAEKVNPYLRPLYDALHDLVDIERATELVEKGVIEVAPLAFMRGRTLSSSFVILDEAQNTTSGQMRMFLTRLGLNSKCVVTGDVTQIDLPRGIESGLVEALQVLRNVQGIGVAGFTDKDVIRHPLVSRIVQAYDRRREPHEM